MARRFQSGTGVHALGSFWDSLQHSTLVANVRHLTTGYVSPQYHCVFNDLFTTVYGVNEPNEVTDGMEQMLWDNSRDLYVEAKYDKDSLLIYEPPPLDEVWLETDSERREAKQRSKQQRERNVAQEKIIEQQIVDKLPPPAPRRRRQTRDPRRSMPDLVSTHGDSSSDESSVVGPIDVADDDSGVLGIQPESEGEM